MHVLLEVTKTTFDVANFIVISVDEIIAIYNTQWLSIHLYMVQKWKRITILLRVEVVGMFAIFNNIFSFDAKVHNWFWGLKVGGVGKKVGYHGLWW